MQFHLTRIYSKLRVSSRAELAAHFHRAGGLENNGADAARVDQPERSSST